MKVIDSQKSVIKVGYFIDNEVQFKPKMLDQCLTAWPKGHANRTAAQAWLDARKGRAGCTMRDVTKEDRLDFVAYCVDIYLGTVTRILRKYDRNHMFLGSRFHFWDSEMKNPACFRVAGKYMDVVSINHYGRWLGASLLVLVFTFLWSLLFIIPGIVKAYSYAMTPYIVHDNPEMPVRECIRQSQRMMKGYKMKLFLLDLSFIGWILLGIISFGIGLLWVRPYMETAHAKFYEELRTR